MTQGIFVRDFISLDHLYLNAYGELTGNSFLPVMTVKGLGGASISDAQSVATTQMSRYKGKILVIEGASKCKVKIAGATKQWTVTPMRKFEDGIFDAADPESLADYMSKDIEIETSLFKAVMPGANLKIMVANNFDTADSYYTYLDHVNGTFEKNIETILKVLSGSDTIEVKLDWYQSGAYQVGLQYAYASYTRIYINTADSIVYEGYSSKIETRRSFDANSISNDLNDAMLFNKADFLTPNKIESHGYSIEFDYENHRKKTSRIVKVKEYPVIPTADYIVSQYGGCSSIGTDVLMSEGMLSGVIRFN